VWKSARTGGCSSTHSSNDLVLEREPNDLTETCQVIYGDPLAMLGYSAQERFGAVGSALNGQLKNQKRDPAV
jgi:hypothetical protein